MATLTLTFRLGKQVVDPTTEDIIAAIKELSSYTNHQQPNILLTLKCDDGAVLTLDANESGVVVMTKLANEGDAEPEVEARVRNVIEDTMISWFKMLRDRKVDILTMIITQTAKHQ